MKKEIENNLHVVVGMINADNGQGGTELQPTILRAFVNKKKARKFLTNDIEFDFDNMGGIVDAHIESPEIHFSKKKQVKLFFTEDNDPKSIAAGIFPV